MHIRRSLAGLFIALTVSSGGATLAGCGDPVEGNTGTPRDTATNTSGSNHSDESQGNLPDNSNREPSSTQTGGDVGNG